MYNLTVPITCNKQTLMFTFGDLSCIYVCGRPTKQEVPRARGLNPALMSGLTWSFSTYAQQVGIFERHQILRYYVVFVEFCQRLAKIT